MIIKYILMTTRINDIVMDDEDDDYCEHGLVDYFMIANQWKEKYNKELIDHANEKKELLMIIENLKSELRKQKEKNQI